MKRWMARFAFSFLIVGLVIGWETYRGLQRRTVSEQRAVAYLICGAVAIGLGVTGMKERHRIARESEVPRDPGPDR